MRVRTWIMTAMVLVGLTGCSSTDTPAAPDRSSAEAHTTQSAPGTGSAESREIIIEVTTGGVSMPDDIAATTGDAILIKLINDTTSLWKVEIVDPTGNITAWGQSTAGTAQVSTTLSTAGNWKIMVKGDGTTRAEKILPVL